MRRTTLSHIALIVVTNACALQKTDDAAEYRQALPRAEDVNVAGPSAAENAGPSTQALGTHAGLLADGARPLGEGDAFWYTFTRTTRNAVNHVTGNVLGSVWFVVHTEPSAVGKDYAEWGPYTDALEPVVWRFRVERVDDARHEYRYVLEGRKKSEAGGRFQAVLTGTGYGPRSELHGDGEFTVHVDVARELEPAQHADGTTSVKITHDLPRDVTRRLGSLPRTIQAAVETDSDRGFTIVSQANADGTGSLVVEADDDVHDGGTSQAALEHVQVTSRWRETGAGRANIDVAGGDLPVAAFSAVECWGADFARSHYRDSAEFQPTFGDASACAYGDAEMP